MKNYIKNTKVKKYDKLIRDKILEEAKELMRARTKKEVLNEIVDIQELLDTLSFEMKFKKSYIKKQQKFKNKKRGSFKKRLFLIKTEK
jgi:predicted house-cleaning noncanonical NTP pyrophosphatase (MazG superfamily)